MVTTLETHWTSAFAWLATTDIIIMIVINMRAVELSEIGDKSCVTINGYVGYVMNECQGQAKYRVLAIIGCNLCMCPT